MQRYKEFRGEHVFMFIGVIKDFGKPTSKEGDEWAKTPADIKKKCLYPPKQIIPMIESGIESASRNTNFDTLYVL